MWVNLFMHVGLQALLKSPKFFPPVENRIARCASFMPQPLDFEPYDIVPALFFLPLGKAPHLQVRAPATDEIGQRLAVLSITLGTCQGQNSVQIKLGFFSGSLTRGNITG